MRIVGVTGGVDTHADTHVAAAIDDKGGLLGVESFGADQAGFEELLGWLIGFGEVEQIGVEGTGSWGVGLARFLRDEEIVVVEVDRPNRQTRRKVGKSDPTDALAAARAALLGGGVGYPEKPERSRRTDTGVDGGSSVGTSTTHPVSQPVTSSGVHSSRADPREIQGPL